MSKPKAIDSRPQVSDVIAKRLAAMFAEVGADLEAGRLRVQGDEDAEGVKQIRAAVKYGGLLVQATWGEYVAEVNGGQE